MGSTEYQFDCAGTSGDYITIKRGIDAGHDGLPLITGTNTNVILLEEDNDYLIIDGIGFRPVGASSASLGGQTIRINGSDYVTIQNCELTQSYNKGFRIGYSNGLPSVGIKILNNTYDTGTSMPSGGGPDGIWLGIQGQDIEIAYNKIMIRHTENIGGYHKDNNQTFMWQTNGSTSYGTTSIHHNFLLSGSSNMAVNTVLEISGIGGNWNVYNNVIVYSNTGSGRAAYFGNCDSGADGVEFSLNKLLSLDPTSFGMGAALQFFYYHPELGPPFLRKLYGETQITISRDPRQMTDWLSVGKFALCIRCNAGSEVGKAVQQQLPIGYLDTDEWKEGGSTSAAGGTLGIPTRSPHPDAAKVFVNWLLSREGQIALQKLGRPDAHNSRRIHIPKDDVDPYNRVDPNKKYLDLAKPEYQDLTPIFKLVKEVLPQK